MRSIEHIHNLRADGVEMRGYQEVYLKGESSSLSEESLSHKDKVESDISYQISPFELGELPAHTDMDIHKHK